LRRPASAAPSHRARRLAPPDAPGAGIARRRLALLLQKLDRWLDESPRVERDGRGRTVWVFGCVGYRVDTRLRGVYPVYRDEEGRVLAGRYTMELFRPLASAHFLPAVLRFLGLSDAGRQRHLFRGETTIAAEEHRISVDAYARLLRDPRFRDLRARRLPAALGLDPVLCAITLASRRWLSSRIASDQYTIAWRRGRELRAVARENPGLLPLAFAALDEGWILPCGDAVKELHLLFRREGLAPATWRYLARHGCRFLRPAWARTERGHCTRSALEFLREIERAGHPAPPPAWALRAWVGHSSYGRKGLVAGWNPVPPEVVRICLVQARRVRGTCAERFLGEDLRLVLLWAARESPRLDKLQRRSGWAWLLRQALAAERRRLLLEVGGPRAWPFALGEVVSGEYRATPVDSVEGLVDEGIAFHNCIADYAKECQEGWVRIFVVRGRVGGRRVGVVRLDHHLFTEGWGLQNVLGIANAPVEDALRAFASDLAERYNEVMAGMPHEGEGWSLRFGEELAGMEADAR
jgi:hypothetical protein